LSNTPTPQLITSTNTTPLPAAVAGNYKIVESQLPLVGGLGGHNLEVLIDPNGNIVAELDGLATSAPTAANPQGTVQAIGFFNSSLKVYETAETSGYQGTYLYSSSQAQATVSTGTYAQIMAQWNSALSCGAAINNENLSYPFAGLGSNSNSVASTLVACMGETEPSISTNATFTPGVGTLLLTPATIQTIQKANGVGTSNDGTLSTEPSVSSVTNNASASTIDVNGGNGTTEVATITPAAAGGGVATLTTQNASGTAINVVTDTTNSSNVTTVNVSGQSVVENCNGETINVAAGSTVTINGTNDIINGGAGSSITLGGNGTIGFNTVDATGATVTVEANSQVNVSGNTDIINLTTGDSMGAYGSGNIINSANTNLVVVGSTNNSADTINATGDVTGGTTANGQSTGIYLNANSQANVSGSANGIVLATGDSMGAYGGGNVVSGVVASDLVAVGSTNNSADTINATGDVTGDIYVNANAQANVGGVGNIIIGGAGATINIGTSGSTSTPNTVIASGATVNVAANSEVNVQDSTATKGNIVNLLTGDDLNSSGGGNTLNVGVADNVLVSGTGSTADNITAIGDNDSGNSVNGAAGLIELFGGQANIYGSSSFIYNMGGGGSSTTNVYGNSETSVYYAGSTGSIAADHGTSDDTIDEGSHDLTDNYGSGSVTNDLGLKDDSNDFGSNEIAYQEGTSDIGYNANSSDTDYVSNGTDFTTGVTGSGDSGGASGGYYGYAGFAGNKSTVAAALGSNISSIAQTDLAQGNQQGALAAQRSLTEVQAAIALGANSILTGSQWDQKVITWSVASQGGKFSGNMDQAEDAAVQQAFATWGTASGLTFKEVSGSSQSDITVGLGDFNTASTGLIGYTTYNSAAGVTQAGAVVQVEDGSQDALVAGANGQLTYAGTQATLEQALLHEIGHALGLADNDDANSIESYYLGSSNQNLDQNDIAAIQSLYGNSSTTTTQTSLSVNQLIQSLASFGTLPAAQTNVVPANQLIMQPPLLAAHP
jgi:predicted Zn-dependent protease